VREQTEKILAEVAAKFNDRRLHICKLSADVNEQGAVKVGGRVLEASYLDAVRAALPVDVKYDVTVLRQNTRTMTVATNITDLHIEPSFLSEMLTQVMNGVSLEVLEEKEKWSLVRQADGYIGWMYRGYLTDAAPGNPTHVVCAPIVGLYAPNVNPPAAQSRLLAGTMVEVVRTEHDGAHVKLTGAMLPAGWVPRQYLRSLDSLPADTAHTRKQIVEDARQFFGTYYLWGGGSAWGIDCSGLAQLAHRINGYTIPRDADLQFAAARPVEPPFEPGDLIFFGETGGHRKITHVGISAGGWRMIHSSRSRNGVYEEDVQANDNLRGSFVGGRTFLK
jgi:cell wall-associated NlpC family hydrolase